MRKNCYFVIFVFTGPPCIYSACPVRYCDLDFEITEITVVYKTVSKCLENNSSTNSPHKCTPLFVLQYYCVILYERLFCFVNTPNSVVCTEKHTIFYKYSMRGFYKSHKNTSLAFYYSRLVEIFNSY